MWIKFECEFKCANLHLWSLRFVFAIEELWQGTPLNFMYTKKKEKKNVNMQWHYQLRKGIVGFFRIELRKTRQISYMIFLVKLECNFLKCIFIFKKKIIIHSSLTINSSLNRTVFV